VAADYFTVETWNLKQLHVLFFIELGRRRILSFGVTANPDQAWVSQQVRNLSWRQQGLGLAIRFLVCDHDKKFPFAIEHVLAAEGVRVIRTPLQVPVANCYAERWVESVRRECLDWLIILGRGHLERVLGEYVDHYNRDRPHRGLAAAASKWRCKPAECGGRDQSAREVGRADSRVLPPASRCLIGASQCRGCHASRAPMSCEPCARWVGSL